MEALGPQRVRHLRDRDVLAFVDALEYDRPNRLLDLVARLAVRWRRSASAVTSALAGTGRGIGLSALRVLNEVVVDRRRRFVSALAVGVEVGLPRHTRHVPRRRFGAGLEEAAEPKRSQSGVVLPSLGSSVPKVFGRIPSGAERGSSILPFREPVRPRDEPGGRTCSRASPAGWNTLRGL